jgi:hypothetical protein
MEVSLSLTLDPDQCVLRTAQIMLLVAPAAHAGSVPTSAGRLMRLILLFNPQTRRRFPCKLAACRCVGEHLIHTTRGR